MTLPMDSIFRAVLRPCRVSLALLWCLALFPVPVEGQCTLQPQGPSSFEPNPPGVPRSTAPFLSTGFNNHLALYQNGSNGPRRLLMQESFGYSVLDVSNPVKPTALTYHDMRFPPGGANTVKASGDGQSYVQTIAASPDGARAAFSISGPGTPPWHTVVGAPNGGGGFTMWGDFLPERASGTVIQQIGARYIAYDINPISPATAADVTALPSFFDALNVPSETTNWPEGSLPSLAGNYLVYMSGATVQVFDASNPGPPGNITGAFPRTALTSADFGGRTPLTYAAAVDPLDANKLWVLVEVAAAAGQNSPSYGLVSLSKGFAAPPQSAGPLFQIPSLPGDRFGDAGSASALIASNGSLFVLMWASRTLPTSEYRLYSTTAGAWTSVPPASFPVSGPGFLPTRMSGFGDAATGSIYAYLASGQKAWVLPMTCQAPNTAASASVGNFVANDVKPVKSCEAAATPAECTVFLGDKITGTINVVPSSASQPLTSWNLDFNFHPSNPSEDGAPLYPRLKTPDLTMTGGLGLPPTPPPPSFTVVGPCDPALGNGNPNLATGAGCWASVMGNAAFGGPDFTGTETSASACKPLTFAVEAQNQFGSTGAGLASLCWKAPAARVQTTQIIAGDSLVSVSDGQPTAYQWSFGLVGGPLGAPTCATPSCAPPSPFNTKGTYAYSLAAKYFVDQAFTGTAAGTYTVTDFVPRFQVNGFSVDPITVPTSQPTIAITNQSSKGTGVVGTYSYSLCTDPCTAWPAFRAFTPAMSDPPSSATIPTPALGKWLLRIHVNYVNPTGQEDWTPNNPGTPDPLAFRITVTNVTPVISFLVNNLNPCGFLGGCTNAALVGDTLKASSTPVIPLDPPQWLFPGATPASGSGQAFPFSYGTPGVYTVTVTQSGVTATANVTISPRPAPPAPSITVNAGASPNPAPANSSVTFSCSASGGAGGFTYSWTSNLFSASGQNVAQSFGSPGNYTAVCRATDSAGAFSERAAFFTIVPAVAPPPACANVNFQIKDATSGNPVVATGGLGIFTYSVRVGQTLSFEPTGTYSSYLWEFGDGATSTLAQAQHAYAAEGPYSVTLTVEGNQICKKTYSLTAAGNSGTFTAAYEDGSSFKRSTVTAFKNIVFTALDLPSQVDSYAWEFSDGFTATSPNPRHAFSATAGTADVTHTVKLTVTREAQSASTTQSFTVISPPEPPRWFVAGMAYANGAIEGTVWQSDVTILNPDPTLPATYSLAFLDGTKVVDPKDLVFKPVTLAARQTMSSSNILGDLFGQPLGSFGALIVRGDVAPVPPTITSRTFNIGDPTKGSFGLSVPSTHTSIGTPPQGSTAPQVLIGLRDDDVAYTNIGLVNLISSDWSHAHLTFFDAAGATLGLINVDVPPYGVAQLNKPLTKPSGADGLGLASSALYRVQVTVEPGGSVYSYATVIDKKSTDPSIVTPDDSPSDSYLIPGIVRQTGRNGEHFRSRVTVANPSSSGRTVRITLGYVACDGDACDAPSSFFGDVKMNPGQSQSWDDFVKVWLKVFNATDVSDTRDYKFSYVDIRPAPTDDITAPLIVLGETYNETPNGDASNGRVGFQISGYTPADGAGPAAANRRLILTGLASTAAYRTNIALFAVAGVTTNWCSVHVYSQDGTKLRDIPVQVGAFTSVSDSALFGDLPGGPYSVVIDNIDAGVTVGGYATIIDNTSGDATFVKAQPAL